MPLWRIFCNPSTFSNEQKQGLADAITKLYVDRAHLPRFYVNVLFIPLEQDNYYIGGVPKANFVRIAIEQIARSMPDPKTEQGKRFAEEYMDGQMREALKPFIEDRGLEWEHHIYETPFEWWRVAGLHPPPPNSEAENRWFDENKASPWKL